MTAQERAALIDLLQAQNRLLVGSVERIQAIETFLHEQPANASAFRSKENAAQSAETESSLRLAVQKLDKALKGEL
jgi:hypothetical protein